MWRSPVAHLHGVQGVEGSNPFTPTKKQHENSCLWQLFFYCLGVCGSGFVAFAGLFSAAGFWCGLMPSLKNNLAVLARLVILFLLGLVLFLRFIMNVW